MKNLITKIFNIKPGDIEKFEITSSGNHSFAEITLTARPTPCPTCGTPSCRVHDYYRRTINHAAFTAHNLTVVYNKRRYYCVHCQKAFPEKNMFALPGKRLSIATIFKTMKMLQKPSLTFSDVADLTGLSTTTVIKIFDNHAGIESLPFPRYLCIDEIYVSKYLQREYACVLLDFETGNIYDLLDSRKKADLSLYFSNISKEARNSVKYISMDMWEEYRSIAQIYFPNAIICIDSFHVIKMIIHAFDKVRIRVMNHFNKQCEEYRLLKRFHWLLKTSRRKIDMEKIIDLKYYCNIVGSRHISTEHLINRLISLDPELEVAYTLKSDYSAINDNATYDNVEKYLENFLDDIRLFRIPEFMPVARTFANWKNEIINSFIRINNRRMSNGPIESTNSRMKKIKRNANGYNNFYRFKLRCLYSLNKGSSIKF